MSACPGRPDSFGRHKASLCCASISQACLNAVAGTGWDAIQEQVKKLEKRHAVHIAGYGEGNERRLTGKHETSSMHDFRWDFSALCADAAASTVISRHALLQHAAAISEAAAAAFNCADPVTCWTIFVSAFMAELHSMQDD